MTDNMLYFSEATEPHINNAKAAVRDSFSASGCRVGTVWMVERDGTVGHSFLTNPDVAISQKSQWPLDRINP